VLDEVRQGGLSWFRWPDADVEEAPARLATRLLGSSPFRVRSRRLEVVGSSAGNYENSSVDARPHTDYDPYLPAHLQVLICRRPAAHGGDSLFLDGWSLLAAIRSDDSSLYEELFAAPRIVPFGPGPWFGPTVSSRLGNLILVHGGMPPTDSVGTRFAERVRRAPAVALRLEEGDVVVCNHQRVLHGRTAFADGGRLLVRLLVWLREPLAAQPRLMVDRARAVHDRIAVQVRAEPEWIRHRLGIFGEEGLDAAAFRHDFSRLPATPDGRSAECRAQIEGVVRALELGAKEASAPLSAAAT